MAINISSTVFTKYEEGVDWMIDNLGLLSKIVYPPIKNECPNCYLINMPGVAATNVYRPGGPYSFVDGVCPYCEGTGFKEVQTSETLRIRTYFDKRTWNKIIPNIGIKNGDALLIGYMKDAPKLQSMSYIELASEFDGYAVRPYTLSTDITPWGIKKRKYFYCTVEKA